jgi:hypothetical protein
LVQIDFTVIYSTIYSKMDQIKNISKCQCAIAQSKSTVNLKTGSVKIINKKSRINIKMNQCQKLYYTHRRLRILFTYIAWAKNYCLLGKLDREICKPPAQLNCFKQPRPSPLLTIQRKKVHINTSLLYNRAAYTAAYFTSLISLIQLLFSEI